MSSAQWYDTNGHEVLNGTLVGGGGGSLPSFVTADDATGEQSLDIAPGGGLADLQISELGGIAGGVAPGLGISLSFGPGGGDDQLVLNDGGYALTCNNGQGRYAADATGIGFLGANPVAQQPEPVTLGDVIAILQAFGLAAS